MPRFRLKHLLIDVKPLREQPAFGRLWAGTGLSSIGGTMTSFAMILQIFDATHSSAWVGALGLVKAVPVFALGVIGGTYADSVDRRKFVLCTSSVLTLVSVLLAVQAYAAPGQAWPVLVLAAVQSLVLALDGPARRTFMPRLLPAESMAAGAALNQISMQVTRLAGPVLAGLVTAAAGVRMCYVVDAVSFLGAFYGLFGLPAMPPLDTLKRPVLSGTAAGIRYIVGNRVLAGAFLADVSAMVLGMPIALLPAINADRFGGSARTLGLLTAGLAIGGLLASGLSGPVSRVQRHGRAMLIAVVVWGAAAVGLGLSRELWLALACLVIAGAADTISVVFRSTVVQLSTAEEFRGRVTSVDYVVGLGAPNLGNFEAGLVASFTSPTVSAVSGGLGAVIGAGLIALAFPAFVSYRNRACGPRAQVTEPPAVEPEGEDDTGALSPATEAPATSE